MARYMGKPRVIAETGAGQHGAATATACALLGLECDVYMGEEDIERQALNVFRMEILGASVHPVASGSRTLAMHHESPIVHGKVHSSVREPAQETVLRPLLFATRR